MVTYLWISTIILVFMPYHLLQKSKKVEEIWVFSFCPHFVAVNTEMEERAKHSGQSHYPSRNKRIGYHLKE